jgi:hypothetical protein
LVWFKLEKRKIRVTIRLEKVKGKRISMIIDNLAFHYKIVESQKKKESSQTIFPKFVNFI